MKFPLVILLLSVLSSCAIHYGNTSSSAALTNGDFGIMDLASGEAKTTHVFGIGGLKKEALVLEAKRNMYRKYPLDDGQIYANLAVDYKRAFYVVAVETKVTVSADVVQFSPTQEQKETDIFSKEILSNQNDAEAESSFDRLELLNEEVGVLVGDDFRKMTLKKEIGKKRYEVMATDSSVFIYRREMIYFLKNGERFTHTVEPGEEVLWNHEDEEKSGNVIGINQESLLIESQSKLFEISPDEVITDK